MKKLKFSIPTLALLLLSISFSANASKKEFTKAIHKEYNATEQTILEVDNRYGNITLRNWPQNKISIDVVITVEESDASKAEKKMSYIDVAFSEEGDLIKAITQIDDKINSNSFFGFSTGQEFRIDYTIQLPVYLKTKLYNKYGNIDIDELHGRTEISVKYGNLKADNLLFTETKPLSEIQVAYGKASIGKTNKIKLMSSYSGFEVSEAAAIILQSKYSEVEIGQVKALVAESKYDEYRLGAVGSIVLIGKYADYQIASIFKKLDLDTKYANTVVKSISADFKEISINSSYGDIKLGIDPKANYSIQANGKYCSIDTPEGDIKVIKDISMIEIIGNIGAKTEDRTVFIQTKYGNVDLD